MQTEETKTEIKAEPKVEPKAIKTNETGAMVPVDHRELMTIINQVAKGGGFPSRFDTVESKIAAYTLANSLMGTRWQLALNNIANIKGQMVIYGELPGALAEQTKEVQEKKVYCIDLEYKEICPENKNLDAAPLAGVCEIQRKGRGKKKFSYTLAEAKIGGQYPPMKWDKDLKKSVPNTDSPWIKFTKIMLMRKAMGTAIKFEFPDCLVGAPVAEYDFDMAPDLENIRETNPTASAISDELNSEFEDESNL